MTALLAFIETGPGTGARTNVTPPAHPTMNTVAPVSAEQVPQSMDSFIALEAIRHRRQLPKTRPRTSAAPGTTGD
ncbi:MAG: hypothetical protein WAL22_10040 [Solirubrobacteraceae bacterium]